MHNQSTRRMAVAQKRDEDSKDVLRRRRTRTKQQKWFWRWFHSADNEIFLYSYDPARPYQEIGLLGILPNCGVAIALLRHLLQDHVAKQQEH